MVHVATEGEGRMTTDEFIEGTAELADELEFTPQEVADMAKRLFNIRETLATLRKEEGQLSQVVRHYLERNRMDEMHVEGIPTLRYKDRFGTRSFDVGSMPHTMVEHLLTKGALTCVPKVVDGLKSAGLLPMEFERYVMRGQEKRLEFDR